MKVLCIVWIYCQIINLLFGGGLRGFLVFLCGRVYWFDTVDGCVFWLVWAFFWGWEQGPFVCMLLFGWGFCEFGWLGISCLFFFSLIPLCMPVLPGNLLMLSPASHSSVSSRLSCLAFRRLWYAGITLLLSAVCALQHCFWAGFELKQAQVTKLLQFFQL